jgi:hypothetical protein
LEVVSDEKTRGHKKRTSTIPKSSCSSMDTSTPSKILPDLY